MNIILIIIILLLLFGGDGGYYYGSAVIGSEIGGVLLPGYRLLSDGKRPVRRP